MNAKDSPKTWEQAVQWLRDQPDKVQLVADCYYDDPLHGAAERFWSSEEWRAVQVLLDGRTGVALDVGAGRGIASYALAKDGFAVIALEPNPSSLVGATAINSLAKETNTDIQVCEEFSERLPFEDNSFDVVYARAVLHHTSNLNSACSEFQRVLKPGGVLLAVREHVISKKTDLQGFFDIHPLHHLYGGENAFLLEEYEAAIRQAGFADIQIISPWHSPINFAPHTIDSLKNEISYRFGFLASLVLRLLNVPSIWKLVLNLLSVSDRRPGRLYSFLAHKI